MQLDLDPSRAPTPPKAAATVLVLRDAPVGLEVMCIVRHPRSTFLGGVVAFPGGKVDPSDGDERWQERATAPHPRLTSMSELPVSARAMAIAACREMLEESAVLPTSNVSLAQPALSALQAKLATSSFLGEVEEAALTLDLSTLVPFARWVTPEAEARRYDATFFLMPLPAHQQGESDAHETTSLFWVTPSALLTRWMAGELQMAPPTTRCIELLAACKNVDDALALASRQSLLPICPRFVSDEQGGFLSLPGDPSHEVSEPRVEGPSRFVLRDGRFVSADPPLT